MDHQPTNEEKARSALCRCGRTGNSTYGLIISEIDELARVYDDCVTGDQPDKLVTSVSELLAKHQQRLDARTDTIEKHRGFFRNRK